MMHRNLDRRVEALVRIKDPNHIAQLDELLTMCASNETDSWHLGPDGVWTRHALDETGAPLRDLQAHLIANRPRRRSARRR